MVGPRWAASGGGSGQMHRPWWLALECNLKVRRQRDWGQARPARGQFDMLGPTRALQCPLQIESGFRLGHREIPG